MVVRERLGRTGLSYEYSHSGGIALPMRDMCRAVLRVSGKDYKQVDIVRFVTTETSFLIQLNKKQIKEIK